MNRLLSRLDAPATLSALWVYVLLNVLFRDMHELFRPGFVEELAHGEIRGEMVDQRQVLMAALALQLPMSLIVLCRVLRPRPARLANMVVAGTMAITTAATWPKDADDLLFAGFELLALAAIAVVAHSWQDSSLGANIPRPHSTKDSVR